MDTQTVFRIVEMLDARINELNKDKKAIDASGYSVLSKRLSLERIAGATITLEKLRDNLQDYIDNQVAHMETEQGM